MKKVIDLSEHNGTVDFSKVKASGINDVILRIGWIGNKNNHTLDKRFNEYFREAKKYGFNVGVYVYSYCYSLDTLINGMTWVVNQLTNKTLELPVFLDLEDESISNLTKQNLTEQAEQFCVFIQRHGYKAGVYASKDWFINKLDISQLLNYKIWLAEWNGKENHTLNYKVDLWQYTSSGKVSGINTRVDMSYSYYENENQNANQNINNGDDIEVKTYVNGSTSENVYSDTNLTNKIGSLNPYEECDCLGIFQNRAIVRYKVDNKQNYKIGFVKWLGGVK